MERFTPHGHCILWEMPLLIMMVISNAIIVVAYFSIPYNLFKLGVVKKEIHRIKENLTILLLFATFIILCGFTHLSDIITMWLPLWYMDAAIRIMCAVVSIFTAWKLPGFIKREIARPSAAEFKKLLEENKLLKELKTTK